jgi:hypothetical protein
VAPNKSAFALLATVLLASSWLMGESAQGAVAFPPRPIALQQRKVIRSFGKKSLPKTVHAKAPQPEPCWKVAGISPEVIARRRGIEQETQARVRQVCADPSLSDQQKRQEIRRLRQAASQESLSLTTPEQRAAVKQCNEERAAQHAQPHPVAHLPRPVMPNPRPHPTGPCGEIR